LDKCIYFLLVIEHIGTNKVKFVMSACLSHRMERFGFHWRGFQEILYLRVFRKCVEKVQVSLKSEKNNGYFTVRPVCFYDNI